MRNEYRRSRLTKRKKSQIDVKAYDDLEGNMPQRTLRTLAIIVIIGRPFGYILQPHAKIKWQTRQGFSEISAKFRRGPGDPSFFESQIKREFKRKRKQKRKQGSLREGREAPPRRCPPLLRFCFRFRLNLRLIWITKKIPFRNLPSDVPGHFLIRFLIRIFFSQPSKVQDSLDNLIYKFIDTLLDRAWLRHHTTALLIN